MKRLATGIFLVALAVAGGLSLLASASPDGLEHTLQQQRVGEEESLLAAPMPDYQAPLPMSPALRQLVAGVSGTCLVAGLLLLLGYWLSRRREKGSASPHH